MAIEFVAAGTGAGSATTATPGMPAGATANDLLILVIEGEGEDVNDDAPPTGGAWTLVGSVASATDSALDRTRATVYRAWYDAAINLTVPDAGDHTIARVYAFRGVDTTTPLDVTSTSGSSATNATSHSAVTGQTSVTDGAMALLAYTHGDDVTTSAEANANLVSVTNGGNYVNTAGSDGTVGLLYGIDTTAGAIGTFSWTSSATEERAWWAMVLRPAVGSQDITPGLTQQLASPFGPSVINAGALSILFLIQDVTLRDPGDQDLIDYLEGLGHAVTTHYDNAGVPANIADYDVVVINETVSGSSAPGADYRTTAIPIVSIEPYCLDEMDIATSHTDRATQTQIYITDDTHPAMVEAGVVNGTVTIFSSAWTETSNTGFGPGFEKLAAWGTTDTNDAIIGVYESGTEMLNSLSAPARRAFFTSRYITASPTYATAFYDLMRGLIYWAADILTDAQDITPAITSQAVTAIDPAVTPGSVDMTPGLMSSVLSVFDPAVTSVRFIEPAGMESYTMVAFSPTVTPGSVDMTPVIFQQLVNTFSPVLTAGAAIVSPDLITSLLTGVNPVLTSVVSLSPALASQLISTLSPILAPGLVNISPGFITNLMTTFPFSLTPIAEILPDLASQLVVEYDPTVDLGIPPNQDITVILIQQLASAINPAVDSGVAYIVPGLVPSLIVAFGPILDVEGQEIGEGELLMTDWSN